MTSREEKAAILQAILSLSQAVINVREMIFGLKEQKEDLLYDSFDKSADAIKKVHEQLERLIEGKPYAVASGEISIL